MSSTDHLVLSRTSRSEPDAAARGVLSAACVMPASPSSVPALRRFARAMARRWDVPDEVGDALLLIVSELVGNAVRHSGSPDVALLLCVGDGTMVVQVKDTGQWRQPSVPPTAAEVGADVEDMACGGRGLPLVAAYASGYAVWPTHAGTRVMAELPLAGPEPALAA